MPPASSCRIARRLCLDRPASPSAARGTYRQSLTALDQPHCFGNGLACSLWHSDRWVPGLQCNRFTNLPKRQVAMAKTNSQESGGSREALIAGLNEDLAREYQAII